MDRQHIRQLIERHARAEGLIETGINGVYLFRVTQAVHCAPVVYEPSIVAIVSGAKEAIIDGKRHEYDNRQYMCCSMLLPVEAGAPGVSPANPLLGVYISLDTRVMTELCIEIQAMAGGAGKTLRGGAAQAFALADWDDAFTDALQRLLMLMNNPADAAILGNARLREVYYAVLKGAAGDALRRTFSVGNGVSKAIDYLAANLNKTVTIDDMANELGMSRAVLHRKFKQATTMSPIQFVKSMRLNTAALKITEGLSVNEAALQVGYVSTSQFSREFKRLFGRSPKQWRSHGEIPAEIV